MKLQPALALVLASAGAHAATAYVSDQLVLGVYAQQNQQGQRLATLHSGDSVETLASSGEYTQVRLSDGATGWVKGSYLVTHVPATVRVKQLEAQIAQAQATAPAMAVAALRSQVQSLQAELAARQQEPPVGASASAAAAIGALRTSGPSSARSAARRSWLSALALLAAAAIGFLLGYNALARRVKEKFGGVKVY